MSDLGGCRGVRPRLPRATRGCGLQSGATWLRTSTKSSAPREHKATVTPSESGPRGCSPPPVHRRSSSFHPASPSSRWHHPRHLCHWPRPAAHRRSPATHPALPNPAHLIALAAGPTPPGRRRYRAASPPLPAKPPAPVLRPPPPTHTSLLLGPLAIEPLNPNPETPTLRPPPRSSPLTAPLTSHPSRRRRGSTATHASTT
jgi:hypothetical protein